MCSSGGLLDFDKKVYSAVLDPFGRGGSLGLMGLVAVTPPAFPKPPKLAIDQGKADAAAQHQKDLLAAAFGLSDTKLTGQQGLGSVPKSLLQPKTTLGGY